MKLASVYKYRSWENPLHRRLLTHGELYFARPSLLNDPFDINIPLEFSIIDEENTEVEKLVSVIQTGIGEPKIDRSKEEFLSRREMAIAEMNDEIFGVFSASTRSDSLLMWSHYAGNHTGFCVEIDAEELAKQCHKHRKVQYHTEILELSLEKLHDPRQIKQIFSKFHFRKSKDWRYENEYRFLLINMDGLNAKDRLIKIPAKAIKKVILGLRASQATQDEIAEICRAIVAEIIICHKVPNSFKLGFTK